MHTALRRSFVSPCVVSLIDCHALLVAKHQSDACRLCAKGKLLEGGAYFFLEAQRVACDKAAEIEQFRIGPFVLCQHHVIAASELMNKVGVLRATCRIDSQEEVVHGLALVPIAAQDKAEILYETPTS